MNLFIDDGYTATKCLDADPGLHGAVDVAYRPALYARKLAWQRARSAASSDAVLKADTDLLAERIVSLNGQPLPKDKVANLRPALLAKLLDLVLSYAGSDEESTDVKNF
jgi:hypothetical protein